jgi:hypothetical protein
VAKKHSWFAGTCLKCGLTKKLKTRKIRMAIHQGKDMYKYEQYYEYHNGIEILTKRPDCKK